ncbi:MAG: TIGR03619 family F420-dependent LLM class oxidoreductase [Chloroflexi bacterium]|nr:TIGR03619 family F420-dependent LLM class oxidoreductase [Chloroflexota bacterium]
MEVGVSLPNIGMMATRENILTIADRAESLGLDSVWVGDHLGFPKKPKLPYPYSRGTPMYLTASQPILDPFAVMAAVAARTQRVRIGTSVLILPYRHPMVTAKLVASIDHIAGGGRVILGVGAGWIPEEFDALNLSLEQRGAMTDEQIAYLREALSKSDPQYKGKFYHLSGFDLLPKPAKPIPVWIGGQSKAAIRRTVRMGDGLHMLDLSAEEMRPIVADLKAECKKAGRKSEEIVLSIRSQAHIKDKATPEERKRPITGSVQQIIDELKEFGRMGIKHVCLGPGPGASGLDGFLRHMEIIAKEIKPAVAGK